MAPPSDDGLVSAFRAGSDDAFTEIDRRYRAPLLAFARHMTAGTGIAAEDVVQDSLTRAYLALRRDERPMMLRAWLYAIARNCALDARRIARSGPPPGETKPWGTSTVDEVLARQALRDVIDAVSALPERQRRALVHCVFEGRTYDWIAAELGISVSAIKALVSRARTGVRATTQPVAEAA